MTPWAPENRERPSGDEHSDDGSESLGDREREGDDEAGHATGWRVDACDPRDLYAVVGSVLGCNKRHPYGGARARYRLGAGCHPGRDPLREPKDERRAVALDTLDRERSAVPLDHDVVREAEPEVDAPLGASW